MKQQSAPYSFHKIVLAISFLFACGSHATSFAAAPPSAPTDAANPGSSIYTFDVNKVSVIDGGRSVDIFLPVGKTDQKFPVIVYGHGQAIDLNGYRLSFEHLAKKGIAVIFPQFDNGFWDQDWRRMADDYNRLTQITMAKYPQLDAGNIVYSGHSKGGYIGLMAAGAPSAKALPPKAVLVFSPAGFDGEYLAAMNPQTPLTVVWGDQDSIIDVSSVKDVYDRSPSVKKQFIEAVSYQGLAADHFFVMTDSSFFGGHKGISALHFYGTLKWMWGAAKDDAYLYGEEASSTGTEQKHKVLRNF